MEKKVTNGSTITITDYLGGGFQYTKVGSAAVALQFFPTAEGYVSHSSGVYNYVFNYKDHLGNNRLSYTKDPSTGVLTILEENHYYPFGLKHSKYNIDQAYYDNGGSKVITVPRLPYQYRYNSKEFQDELNLNLYDYGARMYDPAAPHWGQIDPLAEKHPDQSPYNFCYNNPLRFVDPDGREGDDWVKDGSKWIFKEEITTEEQATAAGYDGFAENGTVISNASINGGHKGDVYLGANGHAAYDESTYANWSAVHGSEYNNAYERFRGWQVDTKEHVGESTFDRNLRLGAGFAHEASREYGSGGYNMFSGFGAAASTTSSVANGSTYSVAFEATLAADLYPGGSYYAHFKAANTALSTTMEANSSFASSMSKLGVSVPRSATGTILGKSPTNWVWHHDIGSGVMQLVPKSQHTSGSIFWETMHPNGVGGMATWNK